MGHMNYLEQTLLEICVRYQTYLPTRSVFFVLLPLYVLHGTCSKT